MQTYLSTSLQRPETRVLAMISGLWMSRLVAFAVRNGVFDELLERPCSAEDLAARKGLSSDVVRRLLLGLVHLGLLRHQGTAFALADDGRLLLQDSPTGFAAMTRLWSELFDGAWQTLDETARTGEPGFNIVHGEPIFVRIGRDKTVAGVFDAAMSGLATIIAVEAAHCLCRSELTTICDVGGCDGSLLRHIIAASPHVRGIVFDQPHVVDRAKASAATAGQATAGQEIAFVGGDFFASVLLAPSHILSNVIHDWSNEDAIRILKNVWAAQPAGGTLYLVEMMLDDVNEPILARSTDLNMLMLTGGRERTRADFDALLAQAGFEIARVEKLADLSCLITAQRIDAAR